MYVNKWSCSINDRLSLNIKHLYTLPRVQTVLSWILRRHSSVNFVKYPTLLENFRRNTFDRKCAEPLWHENI